MGNIRAFHPGVHIKDDLEVMGMTASEFALRTGISERTLSSIINEKGSITFDVASKLAAYFDSSATVWLNLQANYDAYKSEETRKKLVKEDAKLIRGHGLKPFLLSMKIIESGCSEEESVEAARRSAGVNRLSSLLIPDAFVCFKKPVTKRKPDVFARNFWVALALTEARKKECPPFDKKALLESLPKVHDLIRSESYDVVPKLIEAFEKCGVSFVLLPYYKDSLIYGATKWFSKDKVMLALSDADGHIDELWFSLFHELAHVLMAHRRETLCQLDGIEDEEADALALDLMVPKKEWGRFVASNSYTLDSIKEFAGEIGIHPLFVLYRLDKEGLIPYGRYIKELGTRYRMGGD